MSWFFIAIPYLLAWGAILLGLITLIKEWNEYPKPWLRRSALIILMIGGALTFVSLHLDSKEKEKSQGDIHDLEGKVTASSDAQKENTKLFLNSLHAMSVEVTDLKTEVKTEALQKKLESVQADLIKTQKAMQPGPKAELDFSFAPFPRSPLDKPLPAPIKEVTLPLSADGSVHVEFNIANMTTVDAVQAEVTVQICDDCKFAKEPAGLPKLAGQEETERYVYIPNLAAMELYKTISLDVIPPAVQQFPVGFAYRCHTCVLHKGAITGMIHIAGR